MEAKSCDEAGASSKVSFGGIDGAKQDAPAGASGEGVVAATAEAREGGGGDDVSATGVGAPSLTPTPRNPAHLFCASFEKLYARLEERAAKRAEAGGGDRSTPGPPLALLVMSGAFNPPHLGHVAVLEAAAAYCARELGLEVAGAVMSLNHDTVVRNKFKSTSIGVAQAIPPRHRLKLCQEMAKRYAWVAVDRWEVRPATLALDPIAAHPACDLWRAGLCLFEARAVVWPLIPLCGRA